ncbi:hypothetical protein NP233_g12339 [Leucocoprinus birnbaumii]|uniref:F-box domain-containing protein n=1 Tax=Leucocoprinus birnbaumii TaxID=56174 RepID=A0AAD5VEY0_9AGAR|nr:hypothetical protein NP233_g12339 [Leucocoprinus birnbaumii]
MSSSKHEKQLTSDIRTKLASVLKAEPGLSPEIAMARITKDMLQNNPFVPPEGDKCPVNALPDELLAYLFETGVQMQVEAMQFGDEDDDDEFDEDLSSDEEDGEGKGKGKGGMELKMEVVDVGDGDEDGEWSDVDDEVDSRRRRRTRRTYLGNGNSINIYHDVDDDDDDGDEDDEEDEDEEPEFETELPFQVLVSHICKRWRSVALGTPALWTLLNFEKGTPLDKHKAYIERAKNAPLDIIIDCTTDDYDTDEDEDPELVGYESEEKDKELLDCLRRSIDRSDSSLPTIFGDTNWYTRPGLDSNAQTSDIFSPIQYQDYTITDFSNVLDLIIPRVQQWRALSVSVSDYRWMYLLLARMHQCPSAENLDILELYHYDDNDSAETFQPRHLVTPFTPFHGQAPRLRHCVFWGVHLDWGKSLEMLKDVEDIDLAYHAEDVRPSYRTFEAMIKSPGLQTLSLSLSGPRGGEDDWRNEGVETIQLPSLEGWIMRYHSPQYARSLLRFIDTPNLRSLNLDFDEEDYTEFAKDLCKSAFGRSKSLLAGLENFKLSGLPCSRKMVEKMLDELAGLKSLNLNCQGEGELFFEALLKATTSSSSSSTSSAATTTSKKLYCPALESITTAGITGRQMREFVDARKKAGAPVKKVMMSERDEIDISSEKWLKQNVKEFDLFDPSDSEEEFGDEFYELGEFEDEGEDSEDE